VSGLRFVFGPGRVHPDGVKRALPLLALLSASSAFAVAVGDSYAQVIAEKGKPVGVIAGGSVQVLTYPDAIIKVKDDAVVSIRIPEKDRPYVPTPAPTHPPSPTPTPGYDGPTEWGSDLKTALGQAQARKCHLLILFTASDSSDASAKMDAEVYSTPAFAAYAHKTYVLLKLDYPVHTPEPDDVRVQNRRIANHFQVKGYPMVIVLDAAGVPLGRLEGYHEGGPEAFVSWAKQFESP
jgi:hypothetical protein